MELKFSLNVSTRWGQEVYVCGSAKSLGGLNPDQALKLDCFAPGKWEKSVEIEGKKLDYYYFIKNEDESITKEFGPPRELLFNDNKKVLVVDEYRYPDSPENNLYTAPFENSFFARAKKKSKQNKADKKLSELRLRFQIRLPRVAKNHSVGILGNAEFLSEWNEAEVIRLDDSKYPIWSADISIGKEIPRILKYKYVIIDDNSGEIVSWEARENRRIIIPSNLSQNDLIAITDEYFVHSVHPWKAAGFSIPVFSIRTKTGAGVGEFGDIKLLVDWANQVKLKVIQILPVNDTIAHHSWVESYPYAAISVHALHPIYASLSEIGSLKDKKKQKEIEQQAARLNALPEMDYEGVMKLKSRFFKYSFDENYQDFLSSDELRDFLKRNQSWIKSYAAFSFLRDKYQTSDFNQWGKHCFISNEELESLVSPNGPDYLDIAIHYYIQYHLDKQLKESTEYARKNGVVLKGDIPIGIYRHSVDAWRWPHLFYLDKQTGAPPDTFTKFGQNWGFPTYNWEVMKKEGYDWWRSRMIKMSEYFDVFRIDHILGFFRIWEMPEDAVRALMGRFNPSMSYSISELRNKGLKFDYKRFCKPFLNASFISELFGKNANWVEKHILEEDSIGDFSLKNNLSSEREISIHMKSLLKKKIITKDFYNEVIEGLLGLPSEVLLLENENGKDLYDPRITLDQTNSYEKLERDQQRILKEIHDEYFYQRHDDFWKESAMEKIPALKDATNMLICGEDLGMVPDCVPNVMNDLQILSLAVQRMPNHDNLFWEPNQLSHSNVTTTGSHDVSNLREWWHEDRVITQKFYNEILGFDSNAPHEMESWVVEKTIEQHMQSQAMLAIFPIQDLLAMSDRLKRPNPFEERINIPAIIPHYWKYRLHLNIEDLMDEKDFNELISEMVIGGGRYSKY